MTAITDGQVLQIVRSHPGISGVGVHREIVGRTWFGRNLGKDSFWATIFGPGLAGAYEALRRLETNGLLRSEWGQPARVDGPRPRHYYVR